MRCDWVREQLSSYVDDDLGQTDHAQVDEHLAACAACRGEAAALSQVLRSLKMLEQPAAPDLLPGIRAKLQAQPAVARLAQRFATPWTASLPLRGLALATTALFVLIVTRGPAEKVRHGRLYIANGKLQEAAPMDKVEALGGRKEAALEKQADQFLSAREQPAKNFETPRAKDAKVLYERPDTSKLAQLPAALSSLALQRTLESPSQAGAGGALAGQSATAPAPSDEYASSVVSPTGYDVRWVVPASNADSSTRALAAWVAAQRGYLVTLQPTRFAIKLPASAVPALCSTFGIEPPALPARSPESGWATIQLELVLSQ